MSMGQVEVPLVNRAELKTQEEVQAFLDLLHTILQDQENLQILPREKNMNFTRKYGLGDKEVIKFLLDLDISNFSDSASDDNPKRVGEVWIFGKTLFDSVECLGSGVIVYIKLQVKEFLLCIFLHEAEYKLEYPYN